VSHTSSGIPTNLLAQNLSLWAQLTADSVQGPMLGLIQNPGSQDLKTTECFAVCIIHYRFFLNNLFQWGKDKIEDSLQDIDIPLPLGLVSPG